MKASMAILDHEYEGAITISHLRVLGSMVALATSKAELEKQLVPWSLRLARTTH